MAATVGATADSVTDNFEATAYVGAPQAGFGKLPTAVACKNPS
jgi:hypothetical protein